MIGSGKRMLAASIVVCSLPACVRVVVHDEQAAAKAATGFAQAAFVDRDYAKASGMLAPSLARQLPIDKFPEMVAKTHPNAFPAQVTATDSERMPGLRGITIYMKGSGGGEDFYYRMVMEGDATSGYRVAGLFRGNGPHPSTNKRPLK